MKIIIVFQGLLLGALSHPQETCQKGEHQVEYYVYNANVEINVYPCILTNQKYDRICENYNYKNLSNHYPSHITHNCTTYNYAQGTIAKTDFGVIDTVYKKPVFINLCELTASAKLLEGTIKTEQVTRLYNNGRYYSTHQHHVFWPVDACQDLDLMYIGRFDVWTYKNKTKYINNKVARLKLTKALTFCGYEIWETNNDGIIVSTHKIKTSDSTNLYKELNSTLPDDCKIALKEENNSTIDSRIKTSFDQNEPRPPDLHAIEKSDEELEALYTTFQKDVEYLNALVVCLMLFVAFFVLWYFFNVAVNFASLWKAGKRRTSKSRLYLLNCVSQSFTNRYLLLNGWSDAKSKLNAFTSPTHLYESVDYRLCNKPV